MPGRRIAHDNGREYTIILLVTEVVVVAVVVAVTAAATSFFLSLFRRNAVTMRGRVEE